LCRSKSHTRHSSRLESRRTLTANRYTPDLNPPPPLASTETRPPPFMAKCGVPCSSGDTRIVDVTKDIPAIALVMPSSVKTASGAIRSLAAEKSWAAMALMKRSVTSKAAACSSAGACQPEVTACPVVESDEEGEDADGDAAVTRDGVARGDDAVTPA